MKNLCFSMTHAQVKNTGFEDQSVLYHDSSQKSSFIECKVMHARIFLDDMKNSTKIHF